MTRKKILIFILLLFVGLFLWKYFIVGYLKVSFLSYLSLINYFFLPFINKTGLLVEIKNNILVIDKSLYYPLNTSIITKSWIFFCFLLIAITPIRIQSKLKYFFEIIVIHFTATIFSFFLLVFFLRIGYNPLDVKVLTVGFVIFFLKLFLIFLIFKQQKLFVALFAKWNINKELLSQLIKNLLVVLLLSLVFNSAFIALFQFDNLIFFDFNVAHKILALFNYSSIVDGRYLIGSNGNIYMDKMCLGIELMFYFSSFIFLTGVNLKRKFIFIGIGILFINFINILRFVFLFIHLQKYGNYLLSLDFHDLFNYTVYVFIFISWVVWLEFYSDLWPKRMVYK